MDSKPKNLVMRFYYRNKALTRYTALFSILFAAIVFSQHKNTFSRYLPFLHKCDLPLIYSIVFDAGSTGSRIHIYSFYNDSGNLLLSNEIFREVKPGLSSYENDPKEASNSLVPMMDLAKSSIPKDQWPKTSVYVFATAGLRLLSENKATLILNEVKLLLKSYPFNVPKSSVKIMSGRDEGTFAWITINYLLGRLNNMTNTVALLDLGGGSTQITLMASHAETLNKHAHDVREIQLYGKTVKLFTKSYLGLGLMEARLNILGGTKDDNKLDKGKSEKQPLLLQSPCVSDGKSQIWKHRGIFYNVEGHENPIRRHFESCFNLAVKPTYAIFKPEELNSMEIYGVSYFNDVAAEVKLIDLYKGGSIQVVNYQNQAKKYCDIKDDAKSHFLCLDLTYITALLWKGYNIGGLREINLYKKINDVETSWSLGAAIIKLTNDAPKS